MGTGRKKTGRIEGEEKRRVGSREPIAEKFNFAEPVCNCSQS